MYSKRQLTYDKDRLPSIEGVARNLQRQTSSGVLGRYLAGLWSEDLLSNLLWYIYYDRTSDKEHSRRPEKYRAPSWSWASIEGAVDFISEPHAHASKLVPQAEIIDCHTVSTDEFGPFLHGWLKLRGIVVCRDLLYRAKPADELHLLTETNMYGYILCRSEKIEWPIHIYPDVANLMSDTTARRTVLLEGQEIWTNLGPVYAISLASMTLSEEDMRTYALSMKEKKSHSEDGEIRVFERIGFGFQKHSEIEAARSTFFGVEQSVIEVH